MERNYFLFISHRKGTHTLPAYASVEGLFGEDSESRYCLMREKCPTIHLLVSIYCPT